jgi:hypothetical protein
MRCKTVHCLLCICLIGAVTQSTCAATTEMDSALADDFCKQLSSYERAGFEPDTAIHQRHWVEMHWLGTWLDSEKGWRLECRHSPDKTSEQYCGWLKDHTSFEFPDRLPRDILVCHRYTFPDLSYWDGWRAEITLFGFTENEVLLDIDQSSHKTMDIAIRLSVFSKDSDEALQPLPPLFQSSDAADDQYPH